MIRSGWIIIFFYKSAAYLAILLNNSVDSTKLSLATYSSVKDLVVVNMKSLLLLALDIPEYEYFKFSYSNYDTLLPNVGGAISQNWSFSYSIIYSSISLKFKTYFYIFIIKTIYLFTYLTQLKYFLFISYYS